MKIVEVSRGITHFEDLPASNILSVLKTLSEYTLTEKVDGAQILFGIDEYGFYTSRETKGGTRVYNESDYGMSFSAVYQRSAHKLLEQSLPLLRSAGMRIGDQVEVEVVHGELPNVVPYSADTSYVVFLRTTEGTVDVSRLQNRLNEKSVALSLSVPYTPDGRNIFLKEDTRVWEFSKVPTIKCSLPKDLSEHIRALESYLNTSDVMIGQTYATILETPLNKVPDWVTPGTWQQTKLDIKSSRAEIQVELMESYVMPIKEMLLNTLVRSSSSAFGPPLSEGGWIEGVVLRHATTGKMLKLVDKDVFGTVRESAWKKRNMLTEMARGVGSQTGFMGSVLLDLATALGHPELGTYQSKNYLRKFGNDTAGRISALSEGIDFKSVQSYWLSLLETKLNTLTEDLAEYEKETNDGSGGIYSEAIQTRNLQTYSEIFYRLGNLQRASLQAKSAKELVGVLAEKQLDDIDMRIDEIVSLNDVLSADSFITLMGMIKTKPQDLNVTKIKNQVLQSWEKGMRSRKHYNSLLHGLDINLNNILD